MTRAVGDGPAGSGLGKLFISKNSAANMLLLKGKNGSKEVWAENISNQFTITRNPAMLQSASGG